MKILIKQKRWILFLALVAILATAFPNKAGARPQEAIVLLYFQGTGMDNAVLLEWATATEFETSGFVVNRANSEAGPYTEQIGFIPGEGDGIIGAEYEAIDDVNVVNGQTYWYILVEIENNQNQNESDPISVTAGVPTATPSRTPTTQATTPGQATSTPTPSRTPTTSPTTQSGSSTTPTNTPSTSQPTNQNGSPSQATSTSNNNSQANQSNNGTGNTGTTGIAEASAPNSNPYPDPQQTPSPTFVPDPGQTAEPESDAYPGPIGDGAVEDAYPAGSEFGTEGETAVTPQLQPDATSGPRSLSTQPPLDQQNPSDAEQVEPGSSSTLFLWIGFGAAFLIFIGGVIGSIYLFTRRSNQK
jgi:hypothetical protein